MTTPALKAVCIVRVHERAISVTPDAIGGVGQVMPCEVCGCWGYPRELHHRQFRSRRGGWTPSNILLLCPGCHLAATEERAPAGVNVHSWEIPEFVPVKLWYTDMEVLLDNRGGYSPCCAVDNG